MASPQLEDGHTRIANEIIDSLARIRISGEAQQVLWVIFRKTYGFQKKQDAIALSQFCQQTGLSKSDVCRAINKLSDMNIIGKKANEVANVYRFNKDFSTWKPLAKKRPHLQKSKSSLAKKRHTKETITKEINTPTPSVGEDKPKFTPMGAEVIKAFEVINPNCRLFYNRPPQRQAADNLVSLYGLEKVVKVVGLLERTNKMPYMPTITTPQQLESKWSQLEAGLMKKKNETLSKGKGFA